MANTTDLTQTSPVPPPAGPTPPAGTQANPSGVATPPGVNVSVAGTNPNAQPAEEIVAATFRTTDEAERTVADLVAAGVRRENVVVLPGREEKRNFLKRYVHRDGDRHTHAGTAPAYFALIGALVMGLVAVATVNQFAPDGVGPIAAALIGGLAGAALGGITGGLAFRQADDASMEIIENIAADGTLVAIHRPVGSGAVPLDEAGRILERHNGRAMRLRHTVSQADLHPGDLRPDQM